MPRIFISYRRSDSITITGRIYDRLVAVFGEHGVFKDVEDIPFGVDFRSVIEREIGSSEIVLVIIGPNWVKVADADGTRRLDNPDDFVRIEIETALKRPTALVIPVLVMGAHMPGTEELPPSLQALHFRNAAVLREDPDFRSDIERMIVSMREYFRSHDTRAFRGALAPLDGMAKAATSRPMWLFGGLAVLAVLIIGVLLLGSNRGGEAPAPTATRATPTAATEVAQAVSTAAATEDNTPTRSSTDTPTKTDTLPPSDTLIPTETDTLTPSDTLTPTDTPILTETDTLASSNALIPVETDTFTPSDTFTPTETDTLTPSDTSTPTETDTLTPSDTSTPTETDTLTPTDTVTPSRTPTRTSTLSPTELEETLAVVMIEVETQNYETDIANLTETVTQWTPTPTFDARGTASARLRATNEAHRPD